jgi:MinD-like ATPase involved in chromosome partitioning or flagellar assembly
MSKILAFVSIKGGVGKTTLAMETAAALANKFDKRVLLVDANFSAPNVGMYLDLTKDVTLHDALSGTMLHNAIYEAHGFDVVPASMDYDDHVDVFKLKKVLEKFRDRYDFIILDSSPNHDELKPVIAAADRVFLVSSADHVTLDTTMKAARLARSQKTPIEGILVNKIRSPKHEHDLHTVESISDVPVLARVRDHKRMAESVFERKPMGVLDDSNPVAREIHRFASALCGVPEKGGFLSNLFPFGNLMPKEKVNREFVRQKFYESS